jgi:hypothetical protein
MTELAQSRSRGITPDIRKIQESYDAFKAKGLKLTLTRGKPSTAQLDLSADLLSLPGTADYFAEGANDCRNYGILQGLAEARRLFSSIMGAAPEQVVVANNSSLALMHDTVVYSLLKGTCEGTTPWSKLQEVAFCVPCQAMTGISKSVRTTGSV